jgi:mycothiol synthase
MIPRQLITKIYYQVTSILKEEDAPPNFLEMIWPKTTPNNSLKIKIDSRYKLRQFDVHDTQNYYEIFIAANMQKPPLDYWQKHLLPNGFFVAEHIASNSLVAACFASHHPTSRHQRAGNLGWLAVDPAHRGKGLGLSLSAAVTSRLIEAGYERIYLETHDHRLPAIATYLKMGWVPLMYMPEMESRWLAVCKELDWPYTPEQWAK